MKKRTNVIFDRKKILFSIYLLKLAGNTFLILALIGFFLTLGPSVYEEAKYSLEKTRGVEYKIAQINPNLNTAQTAVPAQPSLLRELLSRRTEKILTPKSSGFSIIIPKIGADAQVFPNVDPNDESEYLKILQAGVAHAKGTLFPGMGGTIYLFAHSTDNFWDVGRYNAVFYLIKDLAPDDAIVIFFQNKRYDYRVFARKIIDAKDTNLLTQNVKSGEILLLQTCWPPGTTLKRLIVFAKPTGNKQL